MRVSNGQIEKVSPSRRLGPEQSRPDVSASSSSRDSATAQLPVIASARTSHKPKRNVSISRSAAFLTQILAQNSARHSGPRVARRFPEEPLRRYAQAAALKKSARAALSSRIRPVTV